jgi:hypothetical protein
MNSKRKVHDMPRVVERWLVALLAVTLVVSSEAGCIGYSRSAKRAAYVGNSLLIASGGGALALGVLTYERRDCGNRGASMPAMSGGDPQCIDRISPVSGFAVVGAALVVAGLVGIVMTATRPLPRSK